MKKYLLIPLALCVVLLAGMALTVRTAGYEDLVVSAAGGETDLVAATGYTVGVPTPATVALGPKDLMRANYESFANSVHLICFATTTATQENSTATMSLYGVSTGGAPERIGSVLWEFGTATRSSNIHWADICTPTSTHQGTFTASDVGNNRIAKLTMVNPGYRYLYGIFHTVSGTPANITVQYRPY